MFIAEQVLLLFGERGWGLEAGGRKFSVSSSMPFNKLQHRSGL